MITKWTIGNFKSIAEKETLHLADLTLICGANSSGKSTIIQSMLLLAQTLGSPATHRPLVINGELVKLGFLKDIFHNDNSAEPITIGFELTLPKAKVRSSYDPFGYASRPEWVSVITEYCSPANVPENNTKVVLQMTNIHTDHENLDIRAEEKNSALETLQEKGYQIPPELSIDIDQGRYDYQFGGFLTEDTDDPRSGRTGHCSLRHFLPQSMLTVFNLSEEKLRDTFYRISYILRESKDSSDNTFPFDFNSPAGKSIREAIKASIVNSMGASAKLEQQEFQFAEDLLVKSRNINEWLQNVSDKLSSANRRRIANELRIIADRHNFETKGFEQMAVRSSPFPAEVTSSCDAIVEFFVTQLKYLGPLRDDPKMIFGLPPIPEFRDVGIKGEFTSAILDRYGQTIIECPIPPEKDALQMDANSKVLIKSMRLIDAVILWLQHMQLVDTVRTTDFGKMGVGLSLQTEGLNRWLDLTNVGVGVSQVLPILTMSLLTPKNGLVLLEQPELHLHPKVQAILGDFFLGIASRGTQCIIETHSDMLINRIRRRIAEAEGDTVMKLVQIHFAEKENAKTVIKPVEPNMYGTIPAWPRGFFDESINEAQLILEASSRKRKKKQNRMDNIG